MSENGIDYDLEACLECNQQDGFTVDDIQKVLAVWEGENDEDDWRWVLQLKDGRFVFLQGGCDYTGWDCQSWAISKFTDSAEKAANLSLGDIALEDSHPSDAGLGHMLNIMSGDFMNNTNEIHKSLLSQIAGGKSMTWRENKDEEFGLDSDGESHE